MAARLGSPRALTVYAVVLAVLGLALLGWAAASQVSPPTPPPEIDSSGQDTVPVPAAPSPFFAVALPTRVVTPGSLTASDPALSWLAPLVPWGVGRHTEPAVGGGSAGVVGGVPQASSGPPAPVVPSLPFSPPTDIRIPSIGVASPVDSVGLAPTGEMEVPGPGPGYDHAAWYRYSVTPGQQGPSVIVGHIDSAAAGPSVFFQLGRLRAGDRVEVRRSDGQAVGFAVTDVRTVRKDAFPTATVYAGTAGPELRLISCGGSFDGSVRSYRDNIVVWAREIPVP